MKSRSKLAFTLYLTLALFTFGKAAILQAEQQNPFKPYYVCNLGSGNTYPSAHCIVIAISNQGTDQVIVLDPNDYSRGTWRPAVITQGTNGIGIQYSISDSNGNPVSQSWGAVLPIPPLYGQQATTLGSYACCLQKVGDPNYCLVMSQSIDFCTNWDGTSPGTGSGT